MTDKASIGARLKLLRENCGYTQQQIANVLNIDRSTYAYYEAGKTSPDISTLFTLARIYSVEIIDLLDPERQIYVNEPAYIVRIEARARQAAAKAGQEAVANNSHIYDLTKDEKQVICGFRAATPEQQKLIFEKIKEILAENRP